MASGQLAVSMIVAGICGFGSAGLFYGIGRRGAKQSQPMNFWTGQTIDPESVTDIPAYNRACSRMWKLFSIPCWICGVLALMLPLGNWTAVAGVVILALWGTVGIWWLIKSYKRIEKQYINSNLQ